MPEQRQNPRSSERFPVALHRRVCAPRSTAVSGELTCRSVARNFAAGALLVAVIGCGGAPKDIPEERLGSTAQSLTPTGPTDAPGLSLFKSYFINGDYAVAGVGVRGRGTGTINMTGVPANADVLAAYLYWETLGDGQNGMFRGYPIVGTVLGTAASPCWPEPNITVYRADVLQFLPAADGGGPLPNGSHSVAFPDSGDFNTAPSTEGASLVVVYSHSSLPFRGAVIYDGAFTVNVAQPQFNLTLQGFGRSSPANPQSKMTHVVGDGQTGPGFSDRLLINSTIVSNPNDAFQGAQGPLWDNLTVDTSALVGTSSSQITTEVDNTPFIQQGFDCLTWGAVLFSTTAQPQITGLSPEGAIAGGPSFTLTVVGLELAPNSVVQWDGTALPTTFVSATQLRAQVPSSLISTPQSATITVTANGLTSNGLTFTVDEIWQPILDSQAVRFGQVDPRLGITIVSDWQTGMAFIDYAKLRHDGITSGYIQILEFDEAQPQADGTWVVQNFPVLPPNVLPGSGTPYSFAQVTTGPRATTLAAAFHTNRAAPARPNPIRPPVIPNPARPIVHPIRSIPTNIGGLLIPPPLNPPDSNAINPVDPNMRRADSQDSLTDENSVEQVRMECGPASVANSMEYLGVNDGRRNVPSVRPNGQQDPNSRVRELDIRMGFTAQGTSAFGILNGKAQYIAGANPTGRPLPLTMQSQGRFCPGASIAPNCVGGRDGSGDPANNEPGNAPTVGFITRALTDKKDVELCFAWAGRPASVGPPPTQASPPGAHCVFVTGYRFINGYLALDYTHDLDQGSRGGVDWEDGGHMSMRIGTFRNQLWIRNFFDRPALVTHVMTEAKR